MSALRLPVALAAAAILAAGTVRAAPPLPPTLSVPAIGRDWMDPPEPIDRLDDPNPWPRADAADAGLEDMIHDERQIVGGAARATEGVSGQNRINEHLLRTLRKVGGDYIIVPLLTLHLDRQAER